MSFPAGTAVSRFFLYFAALPKYNYCIKIFEVMFVKSSALHFEKNGYILRPAKKEDAEKYYQENYNPLDKEVARLTGCKESFSRDEVTSFFLKSVDDAERYMFLIISPDGKIIGESVINEINEDLRSANFRIALFHSDECGNGVGSWATRVTRDFAFREPEASPIGA